MRRIEIDLTEEDCHMLRREVVLRGNTITWTYRTNDEEGEDIEVRFYRNEEDIDDEDIDDENL